MDKSDNKRILFYFGGFAPVGGIETFANNLLSHLQTKCFSCQLLCWGQISPLIKNLKHEKVKIIISPWRWGCQWNIPDWLLLPIGLQQVQQADVVLFGKLFPLKILKKLRVKAHKNTNFIYITPYKPSLPINHLEKDKTLESLNLFDTIIVQSVTFIKELRKIGYQKRVEVIPYIPHKFGLLKPLPQEEELKIGFLGRLVEDKNIPLLLHAFDIFYNKYSNQATLEDREIKKVSLHIFGDGHLRQELEQLTQDLGIQPYIIFHGSIPNSQVEEAIVSCHLFAFTSRSEGQCLAALEILACGRPIVATEAGALPEILSDSRLGRLAQSPHPENFASNILEVVNLLTQKTMTPEIIRAAYLERYDSDKIGDRYIEIVKSLIS
ncbi:glycosyltransferase [Nostoc sp.]|uniref:glycosyltransferase n=1 Tax=Nostoc sp. TaxID=1180 RepID=UPI002FF4DD3C